MEALAEANSDAREVDDAVRLGGDIALGIEDTVDDAELEREWMALVKEVEASENVSKGEDVGRKLEEASKAPISFPVESPKFEEKVVESVPLS
jgi:charged multivesicular body protein 7